jgi:hypothetical protein
MGLLDDRYDCTARLPTSSTFDLHIVPNKHDGFVQSHFYLFLAMLTICVDQLPYRVTGIADSDFFK